MCSHPRVVKIGGGTPSDSCTHERCNMALKVSLPTQKLMAYDLSQSSIDVLGHFLDEANFLSRTKNWNAEQFDFN